MSAAGTNSTDELAQWLRLTEGKVTMARAALAARERRAAAMDHRGRAGMEPLLATQRAYIEEAETRMAYVRADLGLAPLPATCTRTDGHGLTCELPFGHVGYHQANPDNLRRRWE